MQYNHREIVQRAEIARKRAHDEGAVNAINVARAHGLKVRIARFSNEGPVFVADHVSAFFDPAEDAIYINKDLTGLEQNFAVAIELGKVLLHEAWARNEDTYVLTPRTQVPEEKCPEQIDAETFARAMLVPEKDLAHYREHFPLSKLARLFTLPEVEFYRAANPHA